ncbi:heme exporter protein CcmB [Desulfovibrio litoralis]|uniref:Heme exporter protein B n=1 Tax=Desulfovibrio litoralis DSM 11393 TaxID=1121455 RepID=A0A1M7RT50_9BACT|nr:heme exporter protein CcmB [Desulfovibrio litoralis]SHN49212.1 heme exporter protein B [Desulfovibrio litoralis DSM 11393]
MLKSGLLIASKDLKLSLFSGSSLFQPLVLGLILIFIFSLSRETGDLTPPLAASTIFWLASVFCQVLIFSNLYSIEEQNGARLGLVLSPIPAQSVWLGKAFCGLILLLLSQLVFLPACIVFLGQNINVNAWQSLLGLFLTDIGIISLGSLLGILAQGQSGRESLLSILLFPLLIPILLAGIKNGTVLFGAEDTLDLTNWLSIILAFDGVFIALGLVLFPFLLHGDD